MPLRPAAVMTTMLVASVSSGMGFVARGYGGELGFDGTPLDLFDALLLWLVVTLPPLGLLAAFVFLPGVLLIERAGGRDFVPFLVAGSATGAILALLGLPFADALVISVIPGALAGLSWWWLAIARDTESSSSFSSGNPHG